MNRIFIGILFFALNMGLSPKSYGNDRMTRFLKSCAYGTLGGAALGLVSISFSDDLGGKTNQVARGASLGLYAGVGYGYYQARQDQMPDESVRSDFESPQKTQILSGISPVVSPTSGLEGARFHFLYSF